MGKILEITGFGFHEELPKNGENNNNTNTINNDNINNKNLNKK